MAIQFPSNTSYYGSQTLNSSSGFIRKLNVDYRTVAKFRIGFEFQQGEPIGEKPTVLLTRDYVVDTANNEAAMEKLERTVGRIKDAKDSFEKVRLAGHDVELRGYTIDRSGNLTCSGLDKKTGKDFTIELGTLEERGSIATKIYDHFKLSAAQRLRSDYHGQGLYLGNG